jgi:ATP-binding cassette subfamily E protein 1
MGNHLCMGLSLCLTLFVKVGNSRALACCRLTTLELGINIFLDGFIPTENLRFREESLSFKMVETAEELIVDKTRHYTYPSMTKTMGDFKLTVEAGSFTDSEIVVMLGENGTGKTTFVRLLAGVITPDIETDKMELAVSLKPQTISPKFPGTVRMLLIKQIKQAFMHPQFQSDVLKPMSLENIMDQEVKTLSGGELQRVAIVLALGKLYSLCPRICHG